MEAKPSTKAAVVISGGFAVLFVLAGGFWLFEEIQFASQASRIPGRVVDAWTHNEVSRNRDRIGDKGVSAIEYTLPGKEPFQGIFRTHFWLRLQPGQTVTLLYRVQSDRTEIRLANFSQRFGYPFGCLLLGAVFIISTAMLTRRLPQRIPERQVARLDSPLFARCW